MYGADRSHRDLQMQIEDLRRLVERQMAMLDRYDKVMRRVAPGAPIGGQEPSAPAQSMDRVLDLLDRAIGRAEALTRDKQRLEGTLDRTLKMLDDSLRTQESMSARMSDTVSKPATGPDLPGRMEETVSKYDQMLERSLAALENAYQASESTRREVDERDRLLSRTLDALESAVEFEHGETQPRQGVFRRMFS